MKLAIAVTTAVFVVGTFVGFLPFCDLVYGCGCDWVWSGGVAQCNVHVAGAPDCPWCAHGRLVGLGVPTVTLFTALGTMAVVLRRGGSMPWAVAAGAGGWGVAGVLLGLAFALVDGYPRFLWMSLS